VVRGSVSEVVVATLSDLDVSHQLACGELATPEAWYAISSESKLTQRLVRDLTLSQGLLRVPRSTCERVKAYSITSEPH
jgi:hypothetical protein